MKTCHYSWGLTVCQQLSVYKHLSIFASLDADAEYDGGASDFDHAQPQAVPGLGGASDSEALAVRNAFKSYFNETSPLTWQNQHVHRS